MNLFMISSAWASDQLSDDTAASSWVTNAVSGEPSNYTPSAVRLLFVDPKHDMLE